jgi:hypothetical protein
MAHSINSQSPVPVSTSSFQYNQGCNQSDRLRDMNSINHIQDKQTASFFAERASHDPTMIPSKNMGNDNGHRKMHQGTVDGSGNYSPPGKCSSLAEKTAIDDFLIAETNRRTSYEHTTNPFINTVEHTGHSGMYQGNVESDRNHESGYGTFASGRRAASGHSTAVELEQLSRLQQELKLLKRRMQG